MFDDEPRLNQLPFKCPIAGCSGELSVDVFFPLKDVERPHLGVDYGGRITTSCGDCGATFNIEIPVRITRAEVQHPRAAG